MVKHRFIKICNREGSALLVAVIVMGILMTLAIGVSDLLIGTLRDNRLLLAKTRAWYAAESGVEKALLKIENGGPGFEEQGQSNGGNDWRYSYNILARTDQFPVGRQNVPQDSPESYDILGFNELVVIPLFAGTSSENSARNFRVDYYLEPELLRLGNYAYEDLDILRWKIFGVNGDGKMEVVNEFLPVETNKNSPTNPTCLGTVSGCWNSANFYENVPPEGYRISPIYPISTFMQNHTQNFLVLTNIINIDLVGGNTTSTASKQKIANIRYRIIEDDSGSRNLTLPRTKISSDGFSGDAKQSIDLEVARETFLPVFNYALYRTID